MISAPGFLVSHRPFLVRLANQNNLDLCEAESIAVLQCERAAAKGKGEGWVVRSLERICRRAGMPSGFASLDDDQAIQIADPLGLSPEDSQILKEGICTRQRQLEMLGSDGKLVLEALAAGTKNFAVRLGITQRRAQQLVEELISDIEKMRNNDEMMATLSRMATRIREADFLDGWEQGGLFGEAA